MSRKLFSILYCLLLCLPPGFSTENPINNTHRNDIEKSTIEQGNALWFSQSVQRCWVCADCPEVHNHRKYPNAFLRFCPPTYHLEASYNCVSYIIQKSEVKPDNQTKSQALKARIKKNIQNNNKRIRSKSSTNLDEVTASMNFQKKEVYKGCAAYEGLCKDIVGRNEFMASSSKSNKLLECYMCKGDMCNKAAMAVYSSLLGIYLLSFAAVFFINYSFS